MYSLVSPNVLLLDGTDEINLERVTGDPPVAVCDTATTTLLTTVNEDVSYWSNLNAVGTVLYVNLTTAGNPIVGFDTASDTLGPPRTYTYSFGGVNRFVVAIRGPPCFPGDPIH